MMNLNRLQLDDLILILGNPVKAILLKMNLLNLDHRSVLTYLEDNVMVGNGRYLVQWDVVEPTCSISSCNATNRNGADQGKFSPVIGDVDECSRERYSSKEIRLSRCPEGETNSKLQSVSDKDIKDLKNPKEFRYRQKALMNVAGDHFICPLILRSKLIFAVARSVLVFSEMTCDLTVVTTCALVMLDKHLMHRCDQSLPASSNLGMLNIDSKPEASALAEEN
ncbi:hypothetical protein Tco_1523261 [Tanacetum coccineum]